VIDLVWYTCHIIIWEAWDWGGFLWFFGRELHCMYRETSMTQARGMGMGIPRERKTDASLSLSLVFGSGTIL
jgi:hypothetical protein